MPTLTYSPVNYYALNVAAPREVLREPYLGGHPGRPWLRRLRAKRQTGKSGGASSIVTLTALASATAEHVASGTSTLSLSMLAGLGHPVAASSTLTLHGTDVGGRAVPADSSDRFTFHELAAETFVVLNVGADTITFSISLHSTPFGMGEDTLTFGDDHYQGSGGTSGGTGDEKGQATSTVLRPVSAATTLTLRGLSAPMGVHLVSASSTIGLHAVAASGQDEPNPATSTITLHGVASAQAAHAAVAVSTLSLHGAASELEDPAGVSTSTLAFSDLASAPRLGGSFGSDTITFTDPPALGSPDATGFSVLTFSDTGTVTIDFGRFRRGDYVPIVFGTEARPEFPPVVVLFDPSNNQFSAFAIPAINPSKTSFGGPLFIDQNFPLGTFKVYAHYFVNGTAFLAQGSFTVVPGGDSGGRVISLFSVDRPEARSVIAQIAKGRLVIGSNPSIS